MAAPRFVHVGPGRYRDTQTGKVINSVMDPNKRMAQQTPQPQTPQSGGGNGGATGGVVDVNRIQNRINFLKKNRPNDPEIKILQNKLGRAAPGGVDSSAPLSESDELDKLISDALEGLDPNFDPKAGIKEATYTDPNGYNQSVYDTQYGLLTQNVQKNYDREYLAKSEELSQRGIPVGSDLYNKQIAELNQRYDDIRSQASLQATSGAREAYLQGAQLEQGIIQNQYNMNLSAQQERDNIRNQLFAAREAIASRKLSAKELAIEKQKVQGYLASLKRLGSGGGGGQDNSPIINAGTNAP